MPAADRMILPNLVKKAIAEWIGTFAMVFVGCGSIMVAERFPGTLSGLAIPIAFGLVVAAMVYAVGHISGAHFNPAVTLAFAVARHFPRREVLVYWIAQFSGALIAVALLKVLLPGGVHYGASVALVGPAQAVIWEAILTFFLMFVIISVATDTRAVEVMAGAAIGITIMFCALLGGPVTGASMNPARSLAPAIFEHALGELWIYFIGPFLGAIGAAWVYERIRCVESSNNAKGCC